MNDAGTVRFFERVADLDAALERLFQRERAFLKPGFERLALDVFHDEVAGAVSVPTSCKRANVRMIQRRDSAGFPLEALSSLRVIRQMRWQNLDRDGCGRVEYRERGRPRPYRRRRAGIGFHKDRALCQRLMPFVRAIIAGD